jgi:hypothetical protein
MSHVEGGPNQRSAGLAQGCVRGLGSSRRFGNRLLAQNFQSAENVLVVLAFIAVVSTTAAIVCVNHAAYKRIAELENL